MTTATVLVGAVLLFIAAIAFAADWWERREMRRLVAAQFEHALAKENRHLRAEVTAAESLLAQLAAENTWLHDELNRRDTRHLRLVTGVSDDDWFARLYDENGCPR